MTTVEAEPRYETPGFSVVQLRREVREANRRADALKEQNTDYRRQVRNLKRRLDRVADADRVIDIARRLERAVNHGEGCWGDIEAELFEAVR